MGQSGLLVLLIILVIVILGAGYVGTHKSTSNNNQVSVTPAPPPSITPSSQTTGEKTLQIVAAPWPDPRTIPQNAPTPSDHVIPTLSPDCVYDQDDLACVQYLGLSREEADAPYNNIPGYKTYLRYYFGVDDFYDYIHDVCIPDLCNNSCDKTDLECPGQPHY